MALTKPHPRLQLRDRDHRQTTGNPNRNTWRAVGAQDSASSDRKREAEGVRCLRGTAARRGHPGCIGDRRQPHGDRRVRDESCSSADRVIPRVHARPEDASRTGTASLRQLHPPPARCHQDGEEKQRRGRRASAPHGARPVNAHTHAHTQHLKGERALGRQVQLNRSQQSAFPDHSGIKLTTNHGKMNGQSPYSATTKHASKTPTEPLGEGHHH